MGMPSTSANSCASRGVDDPPPAIEARRSSKALARASAWVRWLNTAPSMTARSICARSCHERRPEESCARWFVIRRAVEEGMKQRVIDGLIANQILRDDRPDRDSEALGFAQFRSIGLPEKPFDTVRRGGGDRHVHPLPRPQPGARGPSGIDDQGRGEDFVDAERSAVTDMAPGPRLPNPTALAVTSCSPPETGVPGSTPTSAVASAVTTPICPQIGRIGAAPPRPPWCQRAGGSQGHRPAYGDW